MKRERDEKKEDPTIGEAKRIKKQPPPYDILDNGRIEIKFDVAFVQVGEDKEERKEKKQCTCPLPEGDSDDEFECDCGAEDSDDDDGEWDYARVICDGIWCPRRTKDTWRSKSLA